MPAVSVIVPSYNRARFIGATIESILAQTCRDLEVIVVDDGSTDGTREVVEPYIARSGRRVRYVAQENHGVSTARNTGCRLATGRYLAFLDSDDLWKPEKLAVQLRVLDADPSVGLVSSSAEVVDAGNARVLGIKPERAPGRTLREMVTRGSAPPSSFVIRREVVESIGTFDPEIHGMEDLDFCFRVARRWKIVHLEEPLVRYRQHEANCSANPVKIYRAYIRTYEKLLALPAAEIPGRAVRQRLAKYRYLLGRCYAERGEARAAAGELWRAIRTSPLVGLNFAAADRPRWQAWVSVVKPYAAVLLLPLKEK